MSRDPRAFPATGVGYLIAALVAACAVLARIALDGWAGDASGAVLTCLAASLTTRAAGVRPGAAALGLTILPDVLAPFVGVPPFLHPLTSGRLAVVAAAALVLALLIDRSRRAERSLTDSLAAVTRAGSSQRENEDTLRGQADHLRQMVDAGERLVRKRDAAWQDDQRRRREAELLQDLTQHIHELLDVDRMFAPVAAAVHELVAADAIRIALREPGGFRVRHGVGDPQQPDTVIPPGAGPIAHVTRTGRVFRADTLPVEESSEPGELGLPADVQTMLVVPILVRGSTEGVIVAARRTPSAFSSHDEGLLSRIAQALALAVRNSRLVTGEQSARAAAEASNRAKDEFLAMLGHELRNPLGAIGSVVAGFERLGEQAGKLHHILGRQSGHLGRLLDDLLDVSRLTLGKIDLQRRPMDLYRAAQDVLSGFDHEGRLARHDVSVVGEAAWILADPTRLEQVIRNLLDNALKYTPPGGRISAIVATEGPDAVLRVRDTGIGIPPDTLPRIFDLFVQQPRTLDRAGGGLGLGLTVVKRLVELHGGTVAASSDGTDRGSEFVVTFPAVPAGTDHPSVKPAGRPDERQGAQRCRVAIVEDYADAREALEMVLRFDGHEVRTASDGPSGLELILAAHPHVAFIDIGLPGLTGYEIARRIRQAAAGTDYFLVAITGYGQSFDRTQALEAGFDDHLVKPVDPGDLARVMARASPGAR